MTRTSADRASSRRAWVAVGLAWLGSLAVLLIWLLGTSTGHVREQLRAWQFWSLDACVLLGVLVGVFSWKTVQHDA